MTERLVSLVTTVDDSVTGGHLYNRHMSDQAPRHRVRLELIPIGDLARAQGLIVVDSLVASAMPTSLRSNLGRLAALVHQVPGGVDGSRESRRARRSADLALYQRCDLVIAASPYLGEALVKAGIAEDRVVVVVPGCDLQISETSAGDMRLGRRLALVNVANWLPNKGILELLDAIEPIPSEEVVLHLVGSPAADPHYAAAVQDRLRSPALSGKVVLHGVVTPEEMGGLYAGADSLVLTSHDEGYATVVAEALRAGLPVLAWSVGNIPNLLTDGEEGILLPRGDLERLRDSIRRLAGDGALRSEMASKASIRGSALPTWEQSGDLFFATLDRLLPPV